MGIGRFTARVPMVALGVALAAGLALLWGGGGVAAGGEIDRVETAGAGGGTLEATIRRSRLAGGTGRDSVRGGPGEDRIFARDRRRDLVVCGPGEDVVNADPRDGLRGCETVLPRRG